MKTDINVDKCCSKRVEFSCNDVLTFLVEVVNVIDDKISKMLEWYCLRERTMTLLSFYKAFYMHHTVWSVGDE